MSRYTQLKFQPKSSIRTEVINILVKSKMAAAAILDFQNFALLMKFSNICYARYTWFKLQPKSSIRTEVINILVKSKMAAAAILDFQYFSTFNELFQFLLCLGIHSSNCSPKA